MTCGIDLGLLNLNLFFIRKLRFNHFLSSIKRLIILKLILNNIFWRYTVKYSLPKYRYFYMCISIIGCIDCMSQ